MLKMFDMSYFVGMTGGMQDFRIAFILIIEIKKEVKPLYSSPFSGKYVSK